MFEDKKRDELEALMAAWVGEVGQLNKAVQELPSVFQKALGNIETEFNWPRFGAYLTGCVASAVNQERLQCAND